MEILSASIPNRPRNRAGYAVVLAGVIALGLASRRIPGLFPAGLGKYPGDVLWALMVFVGWGLVFPGTRSLHVGGLALGFSFAVEFFKLCQPDWITGFRDTTLGHLILGYTFSWQNLVAYTVGVAFGMLAEWAMYGPGRKSG